MEKREWVLNFLRGMMRGFFGNTVTREQVEGAIKYAKQNKISREEIVRIANSIALDPEFTRDAALKLNTILEIVDKVFSKK